MNGGQRIVLGAWAAMAALATIRSVATKPGMPPPSIYFGQAVLFSFFTLGAAAAPPLFATLAVGAVVAGLLRPYLPGGSGTSPLSQLGDLIGQVSGSLPQQQQQQSLPQESAASAAAAAAAQAASQHARIQAV